MEPNEIREMLQDRNLRIVAVRTGINYFSLARFVRGDVKRVTYEMCKTLSEYLSEQCKAITDQDSKIVIP
jgi:hypothetical protein